MIFIHTADAYDRDGVGMAQVSARVRSGEVVWSEVRQRIQSDQEDRSDGCGEEAPCRTVEVA